MAAFWGRQAVKRSVPRLEVLAVSLLMALSSMTVLSLTSDAPLVDLSAVGLMGDGQEILTRGVLADLHRYDSGLEALVVAAPDGQGTLKAYVSQGLKPSPSAYARIGDTLRLHGRVSNSGREAVLYCDSDSVLVEARAESALTLDTLSRMWPLLLGDEIRLRGIIVWTVASECCRLFDIDMACSIQLTGASMPATGPLAQEAMVIGILRLDHTAMSLFVDVTEVLPAG